MNTLRSKSWSLIIIVLLIALGAAFFDYPVPENFPFSKQLNSVPFKLGLDLQGGAHLVYEADVSQIALGERDDAVEGVRDVIERRVNALGISEPLVQTNRTNTGDYRVIIELAGVFDINEAIGQIGETPLLEFREIDETATGTPEIELTPEQVARNNEQEQLAGEILEKAKAGEDFAELAAVYSEDTGSSQNGGDLGFIPRGAFVPEFEDVIFDDSLAAGEVWPEVVRTQFGWHIIKKEAERGEGDELEIQSRHILLLAEVPQQPMTDQNFKNTDLTGKQLESAQLVFDPNTNEPQVSLRFDKEGDKLFQEITARNVGRPVAIYLDGQPISVPVVQQEITGGEAVITGQFSIPEAKTLAIRLNAGALPVPIDLVSQQTVGPSLGQASMASSLKAGMFGLLLVALFMIFYYRLAGVMSVLALAVYASVVLLVFKLMGVTLTLAGIAGFIFSMGLAVDANVLIFERMKEELKDGRTIPEAIETGFARAWTSIRDSNFSSLLTALILYWFGSSLIRGFAITLGIGIILSMFSAIIVTRSLLRVLPSNKKLKWWLGAKVS